MLQSASARETANSFDAPSAIGVAEEHGSTQPIGFAPVSSGASVADPGAIDARNQLFAPYADANLYSSTGTAGSTNTATRARGPKKSATKAEVQAIQSLIDRAKQAEQAAAELDREAKALQQRHDPGAHAKALQADEKWRLARGLKQEAIAKAVSAYGIDISHVSSLLYDHHNPDGDAETDDDRRVTIGDAAFTNPGNLGSTIAHEAEVHVNLQSMKGRAYSGPQGAALNEIQAYDYEIVGAKRFGLTKDEIDGLRRNRAHYMEHLDDANKKRRAAGDYSLPKGHEED